MCLLAGRSKSIKQQYESDAQKKTTMKFNTEELSLEIQVPMDSSWSKVTESSNKEFRVAVERSKRYIILKLKCYCDFPISYWHCGGKVTIQVVHDDKESMLCQKEVVTFSTQTKIWEKLILDDNKEDKPGLQYFNKGQVVTLKIDFRLAEVFCTAQDCLQSLRKSNPRKTSNPFVKLLIGKLIERNKIEEMAAWYHRYQCHKYQTFLDCLNVDIFVRIFLEEMAHLINWHFLNRESRYLSDNDIELLKSFFEKRKFSSCPDLEFLSAHFTEHGFDHKLITNDKDRIKRIVDFLEKTQLKWDSNIALSYVARDHITNAKIAHAIAKNDFNLVKYLDVSKIVKANFNYETGNVIHIIARNGNLKFLTLSNSWQLLQHGNESPLQVAMNYGNKDMVRYFLHKSKLKFTIENDDQICIVQEMPSTSIVVDSKSNSEMFQLIAEEIRNKLVSKVTGKPVVFKELEEDDTKTNINEIAMIQCSIASENYKKLPKYLMKLAEKMTTSDVLKTIFQNLRRTIKSFRIIVSALIDLEETTAEELDDEYVDVETAIANDDMEEVQKFINPTDFDKKTKIVLKMAKKRKDYNTFKVITDLIFENTNCSTEPFELIFGEGVVQYLKCQALLEANEDIKIFIEKLLERNQSKELAKWAQFFLDYENPVQKAANNFSQLSFIIDEYFKVLREEHDHLRNWHFLLRSKSANLSSRDLQKMKDFFELRSFKIKDLKDLAKHFKNHGFDLKIIVEDKQRMEKIIQQFEETLPKMNPELGEKGDQESQLYKKIGCETRLLRNYVAIEALKAGLAIAKGDFKEAKNYILHYSKRYKHAPHGRCRGSEAPKDFDLRNEPDCIELLSHLIAKHGNIDLFDFVTIGQRVGKLNEDHELPLHIAIQYQNLEMIKHLAKKSKNIIKATIDQKDNGQSEMNITFASDQPFIYDIKAINVNDANIDVFECLREELIVENQNRKRKQNGGNQGSLTKIIRRETEGIDEDVGLGLVMPIEIKEEEEDDPLIN